MSAIDILAATDGAARWDHAIAGFDQADLYARHGYVHAAAGDDALLVHVRTGDGELAVPLLPQPLPDGDGWDAESPYGYPGVLVRGDVTTCWPVLRDALAARGIINLFLRLHPFADHAPCAHLLIGAPHATAWIPLTEGRAQAFAGGDCSTHRSQVNRARRLGFSTTLTVAPSLEDLRAFRALYEQTMERLAAGAAFRFGETYFARLASGLGQDLVLVSVVDTSGLAVAQALLLCGPRYGHYHLSARRDDVHNAASNLLFEAMADHAAARGMEGIHLGGGMSAAEDDSLLQFKRRIGRGRSHFCVAGLVCDLARHQRLIDTWRQRSGRAPTWFQAYRQPLAMETKT
jgi:Acetyltransferase (GNAT) domain